MSLRALCRHWPLLVTERGKGRVAGPTPRPPKNWTPFTFLTLSRQAGPGHSVLPAASRENIPFREGHGETVDWSLIVW